MSHTARIIEYHRGLSRSTNYHFVIDGVFLRHISEYAVQKRERDDYTEYYVDVTRIRNKPIIRIGVSNSGIICGSWIYRAEELMSDPFRSNPQMVELSYMNSLQFSYLLPRERMFLENEWKKYYLPMLMNLRNLVNELMFQKTHIILPSILGCQVTSGANFPLSFLIPYSGKAREKSLEGLSKFIHQAWILLRLYSELRRKGGIPFNERESRKPIILEQSSDTPAFTYVSRDGLYSVWWEFDLTPHVMCSGIYWFQGIPSTLRKYYDRVSFLYRRQRSLPLRPDIVILKDAVSCHDILERGLDVLAVLECKNQDYEEWSDKVETQVKPYAEIFTPQYIFLISMKPVPQHVKEHLLKYGVTVVDEAYPGGRGEYELIRLAEVLI